MYLSGFGDVLVYPTRRGFTRDDFRAHRRDRVSPPAGHHVVAASCDGLRCHVTSDGQSLWIWDEDREWFHDPVDLAAAALDALSGRSEEALLAADEIQRLAAEPPDDLGYARIFSKQGSGEKPRWPTLVFVCAGRVVASQLDFFDSGYPQFRVSAEEVLALEPFDGLNVVAVMRKGADLWIGNVPAVATAFDDSLDHTARFDASTSCSSAALRSLRPGYFFGLANDDRIALGRWRPYDAPTIDTELVRSRGEDLVGVTPRREAVLTRGNKIVARTADQTTVLESSNATIRDVVLGTGIGFFRTDEDEHEIPTRFLF